jgi:hypothetical protein
MAGWQKICRQESYTNWYRNFSDLRSRGRPVRRPSPPIFASTPLGSGAVRWLPLAGGGRSGGLARSLVSADGLAAFAQMADCDRCSVCFSAVGGRANVQPGGERFGLPGNVHVNTSLYRDVLYIPPANQMYRYICRTFAVHSLCTFALYIQDAVNSDRVPFVFASGF